MISCSNINRYPDDEIKSSNRPGLWFAQIVKKNFFLKKLEITMDQIL